jgi:phage terminase small subunit
MAIVKLTPKQEAFCHKYIEAGNASEAYRHAYSCAKMKPNTIKRKAKELIDHNKISATIRLLRSELKKNSDIRKEDILEELSCVAFSDIRDYVDFDGTKITFKDFSKLTDKQAKAIEGIKQNAHGIELKLHGKSWTIERICKMLGYDEPDQLQVSEKGSVPITAWLKKNKSPNSDEE